MLRFFYTLCFISVYFSVGAQQASLKGNLIDNITKKPIIEAYVSIEDTEILQKTNELGEFLVEENLPIGEITIIIQKVGYITRKFQIQILEGKSANIKDIALTLQKEEKVKKEKNVLSGTSLVGVVSNKQTKEVIADARVTIVGSYMTTSTDEDGSFVFNGNVPEGPILLKISKEDYTPKMYNTFTNVGKTTFVEGITLGNDLYDIQNQQINTYADDQLDTGNEILTNNSGFYQSSSNIFLKTAAFQFSSSYFKVRGQDVSEGEVMINGVSNNSPLTGAMEWNSIAGLEEVMQNNQLSYGLSDSKYSLGGNLGSLNINTRASAYMKGGKISYLSSNRNFSHGVNATYATGQMVNGFSLAISATKRTAVNEGYFDGTPYDSNSFLISAETRLNSNNAINFTGFFNATNRGGRSANTEEVFNLKDNKYNSFWGLESDEIQNSRMQNISQPFLMLSHYLNVGANIKVQTNLAYSFGSKSVSNLDFQGASINNSNVITASSGTDPNPTLISKLPSYFFTNENNPNYEGATLAREAFENDGQINWFNLYDANIDSGLDTSIYALYDEVEEHSNLTVNTIADIKLSSLLSINGALSYSIYNTNNFARINDLLGGQGYLDVSTIEGSGDARQSDLLNPNRTVGTDDTFRYNYDLNRTELKAFVQAIYKYEQFNTFIGFNVSQTNNNREGNYQNGRSPNLSLGEGKTFTFLDYNIKAGLGIQIDPLSKISVRVLYGTNSPSLNNMFLNAKESDNPRDLPGVIIQDEIADAEELIAINQSKNLSAEIRYEINTPLFEASIAGYFNKNSDGTSNRLFSGNSLNANNSSTIQEVITGIDKKYMGLEIGAAYKLLKTLSVKSAVAIGDYVYTNNPDLQYIISEDNVQDLGEVSLENYHITGTPSTVFSVGFEYRDEDNWWFEAMGNYFADQYTDINPYFRTRDFFLDSSGNVFGNFDVQDAASLLEQKKLDSYLTINLFGGKYWEINENYIGFKIGVNNILGQSHYVGGFEPQGQIKYNTLIEDSNRQRPLYGNRYWSGYGATYFANLYYKF